MRVLFVGRQNAHRSPMAEGLLRFLMPAAQVVSAGLSPAKSLSPFTVAVMRERSIDVRDKRPTPLTAEMVQEADIVVAVGQLEPSPLLPEGTTLEWDVPDLSGQPIDVYRRTRQTLERLIADLIDDLETFRRLQMKRQAQGDPFASYFPGR